MTRVHHGQCWGISDSRGEMNKRNRNMKPYKAGENCCQISTWGVSIYKKTNLTYAGQLHLFCMKKYRNHI